MNFLDLDMTESLVFLFIMALCYLLGFASGRIQKRYKRYRLKK